MKKYIKSAVNSYNLKELIKDPEEYLELIGFTWISKVGIYAAIYGTGLVLYSFDADAYFWIRNGADYADEIFTGMSDEKLGLDEIVEELGTYYEEYAYFEEI